MHIDEALQKDWTEKTMIVFDLDGTLTESKSTLTREMSLLLQKLLAKKQAAIIGGGSYGQFEKQFLAHFSCPTALLKNLSLFPTSGTRFYAHDGNLWQEVYSHTLSSEEKQKIFNAFERVFEEASYEHPHTVYGEMFEDRGTQIAFSFLGQDVVLELGREEGVALKEEWNRDNNAEREKMVFSLREILPEFEVRTGGLTTIDVTKKGIDKGYGIRQIETHLKVPKSEMLFMGDALHTEGNDYPVLREGVHAIAVKNPHDTKKIIEMLLS